MSNSIARLTQNVQMTSSTIELGVSLEDLSLWLFTSFLSISALTLALSFISFNFAAALHRLFPNSSLQFMDTFLSKIPAWLYIGTLVIDEIILAIPAAATIVVFIFFMWYSNFWGAGLPLDFVVETLTAAVLATAFEVLGHILFISPLYNTFKEFWIAPFL